MRAYYNKEDSFSKHFISISYDSLVSEENVTAYELYSLDLNYTCYRIPRLKQNKNELTVFPEMDATLFLLVDMCFSKVS